MSYDPSLLPKIIEVQLDPDNGMGDFEDLSPYGSLFLAEMSHEEGALIPGSILVGPLTAEDPTRMKVWECIEVHGEGRAMVLVWVDDRFVASGMLELAKGSTRPRRLNLPRKYRTGYKLLVYIAIQGKLLAAKAFCEGLPSGDD
jgi:hypothetical protein